ncbi:hypothetical protein [Bartonella sp. CB60]|uniref:hypothetical protein n=1 Tax=Bartonella sp. CB60 TaxID=3113619 RepID=UPI00300E5D6B
MLTFEYADIFKSITDADTLAAIGSAFAAIGSVLAAIFTGCYAVSWKQWVRKEYEWRHEEHQWKRTEYEEKRLGNKLQISSCGLYDYIKEKENRGSFKVNLTIYNPTGQLININYIELPSDSPFTFFSLSYYGDKDEYKGPVGVYGLKRIDFRDTIKETEETFTVGYSHIPSQEELKLWLMIDVTNEEELIRPHPISITLEHTSSNDPRETLKVIFVLGFIKKIEGKDSIVLGDKNCHGFEAQSRFILIP